jgi:hypothetical protein
MYKNSNPSQVTVNGQHYATFTHRNPYQEANFLEINGDVQLTSIRQW